MVDSDQVALSRGTSPTHAPATVLFSKVIRNVNFAVVHGSLVYEKTDAIVNPTGPQLDLSGTLSKLICLNGGDIIKNDCKAAGSIPSGGSVVTNGGNLTAKYVVHVESPSKIQDCVQAVGAAIQAAAANGIRSMAFPPLGCGGKGLPIDQVAERIVDFLVDAANENNIGGLTEVRLVGFTDAEKTAFESALKNVKQSSATPSPTKSSKCAINGITIEVIEGSITDEATDAIVNPTDEQLGLTGNLSKAIVAAGGQVIVDECRAIGTMNGLVAHTTAGSLPSKHIVHVLSPNDTNKCQEAIRDIIDLCVQKQIVSIAIPPIGISNGLSPEDATSCIASEVVFAALQGSLGSIAEVHLVAFKQDEKTAFEGALNAALNNTDCSASLASPANPPPPSIIPPSRPTPSPPPPPPLLPQHLLLRPHRLQTQRTLHIRIRSPPRAPATPIQKASPPPPSSPTPALQAVAPPATFSVAIKGVQFAVAIGSVTDENTDAIVNPTDANLKLEGALSKAIIEKGGKSIADECQKHGKIPERGAIVTEAGALASKFVVHVASPCDMATCRQAVRATIRATTPNSCKSLAIPPLGAAGRGLPLDQVTGCIVDTLTDAADEKTIGALTLVRLVGFTVPEKDAFEVALRNAEKGIRNVHISNLPAVAQVQLAASTQTPIYGNLINNVTIHVLKGDLTQESTNVIVNPTDANLQMKGNLSVAIIAKGGKLITSECATSIKQHGALKGPRLTGAGRLQCRNIVHVVSPINTNECETTIKEILKYVAAKGFSSLSIPMIGASRGVPLEKAAACITKEVVEAAQQSTLQPLNYIRLVGYTQVERDAFENALRMSVALSINASEDIIDGPNGVAVSQPRFWTPFTNNETWKQVLMRVTDSDYNLAKGFFTLTNFTLKCIYRIQNPTLYSQFLTEKAKMRRQYTSKFSKDWRIEGRLYHGTKKDTVPLICGGHFDRHFVGVNADLYGCGTYFARDMDYSANDTYSKPDPSTNEKCV